MDNKRVYRTECDISSSAVQNFFNNRKQLKKENIEHPYVSVLLGDQDPSYSDVWDAFEKDYILPLLNINETDYVLDIGCGIGRWGESIIPICDYYCGADFSSEMIATAKKRVSYKGKKYDFISCSFQDISEKMAGKKFNKIIIAGVCMYINDGALEACFSKLRSICSDNCTMYITETIALNERLSLVDFYSTALQSSYNAIYRTAEEYNKMFAKALGGGYMIYKQGILPHLNTEQPYNETDRWYTILRRGDLK